LASQSFTVWSQPAEASQRLSWLKARWKTRPDSARSLLRTDLAFAASQTIRYRPWAAATDWPSGLKATPWTRLVPPGKAIHSTPVANVQILAERSRPPAVARSLLSGLKAIPVTSV